MKNILFILHFPPPVHGSSMVGQSIKNSHLINNTYQCRYISYLFSRNIVEIGKLSVYKITRILSLWFELLTEIIKQKPDVCYLSLTASGPAFIKDVFLIGMLRFFRIKRVYHLHNKGVDQNKSKLLYRLLYRFVFKDANIILLSKQLYYDIEQYVPEKRIYICPNGIDDISPDHESRVLQKDNPVRILFLSNLIESKGVYILLDACSILQEKGINFECDFIGDEGDIDVFQFTNKVTDANLTSKVKYLGKKFGKDKQEIFANADIFALPTYYSNECFPLVLLEAMSVSLPVISTCEGGISDIVEDGATGFLVSKKNASALADKLEILITNPKLRQQFGKAGRLKFEKEFTLSRFENRITEILQQVILTEDTHKNQS